MAFVQNDFYYRWVGDRVDATYNADITLDSTKEYIQVDTSLNTVEIELPNAANDDILNGKKIYIIDTGNAETNNITIIPNIGDLTTIEGNNSYLINKDNTIVGFELVNLQWVVIYNSNPIDYKGWFTFTNNNLVTTLLVNTYTDIEGVAQPFTQNEVYNFSSAPNILTYVGILDIKARLIVSLSLERETGNASRLVRATLFKNGLEVTDITSEMEMNQRINTLVLNGLLDLSTNDEIKVMIRNETNGNSLIVRGMSLTVGT